MDFIRTIDSDEEPEFELLKDDTTMKAKDDFFDNLSTRDESDDDVAKEWDFLADGQLDDDNTGTTLEEKIERRKLEREKEGR